MASFEFDKRVSVGNLLVVVAMVGTGIMAWQRLESQTSNLAKEAMLHSKEISANESRIRSLEYTVARQDERLAMILSTLQKIEQKVDVLTDRQNKQ